eukprot:7134954-Prymnesium_polylepis.1
MANQLPSAPWTILRRCPNPCSNLAHVQFGMWRLPNHHIGVVTPSASCFGNTSGDAHAPSPKEKSLAEMASIRRRAVGWLCKGGLQRADDALGEPLDAARSRFHHLRAST